MEPAEYDAWYNTPRGRWIGETENRLLLDLLAPQPGERVLDVGCGTGWFTRRLAGLSDLHVTGVDLDAASLSFAHGRDPCTTYIQADALSLPFADDSFDRVLSVTALCFVPDWPRALSEIVRVARNRFVIGLLNRNSLLWHEKGRDSGQGAYRGAHWHTRQEVLHTLAQMPVLDAQVHTAVFLPSGSHFARWVERHLPASLPFGSFLLVSGDKTSRPRAASARPPSHANASTQGYA